MDARVAWFYRDLTMVLATSWRCESRSDGLFVVHHEVAFADEAGMAEYRAALAVRGRDQAWEQRRRDQDHWYRIVARSIQNSPPVPMTLPRPDETAVARREAAADDSRA
jgi:hypothetical protein